MDFEVFVAELEKELEDRYEVCEDLTTTPNNILLAVLNAVKEAKVKASRNCHHNWVGLHGHPAAFECQFCGALLKSKELKEKGF